MTYFGEHTPKLGFGMMRLPRTNGQIDIEDTICLLFFFF